MIVSRLKAIPSLVALLLPIFAINSKAQLTREVLETVKATNTLTCGVIREEEDYSKADTHGNRAALDRDICKGLASAVLSDKGKVIFATYPDEPTAIKALNDGKVEVIASATPSFTNATVFHVGFSPVIFFDGQGFLVNKSSGITDVKQLDGKKVCFIDETTNAVHLPLYGAREKIRFLPFPFEEQGEMEAAMYTANCAAMTTDITQLANTRARFNSRSKDFALLPQVITKDPLAVAYRSGDAQWAAVVDWTTAALIQAEESGVTAANIDQQRETTADPAIQLYFSRSSGMGTTLGLDADWAVRAVKSVGNYGELYERDLGSGSPLQIPRGMNALWSQGGLIYAPVAKR
jgi:general L-amino acid transport system substrate-binding protein